MSDDQTPKSAADAITGAPEQDVSQLPQFRLLHQYVKDQSFENPNAPGSFLKNTQSQPMSDIHIDVHASHVGEDTYESVIVLKVSARQDDMVIFISELEFGGLFTLKNIPEENLQPVLLVECPKLLFPFARRIVADMTRDGGYPPVMLEPIDFLALYRMQMQNAQQQAGQSQPDTGSLN